MSSGGKCRECGATLASEGPTGLCAKCLLLLGLEQEQGPADTPLSQSDSEVASPPSPGEPPKPPEAEASADRAPLRSVPSEKPGDEISGYKLLEEIGHGGFGVVYL